MTRFTNPLPNAPANLTTSNVTATGVNLAWDAVEDASGYDIYQDGAAIDTVTANSHTVTGLDADTTYEFYVVAKNDKYQTESAPSKTVTVTTGAQE
ncbi:fibronectin type III domain-containing protein [Virgibacillus dakarensis]|nr:fibronectin type III domain-containing protein [Virgibacillus dakarensis]MBT2215905.1 fibronectin type III domain-containing protein [Virgibacillus dakarensis]